MLKKKSLILMLLFSFLAHMSVAGTLIFAPLQFSRSDRAGDEDEVIWGFVKNDLASEGAKQPKNLTPGKLREGEAKQSDPKGHSSPVLNTGEESLFEIPPGTTSSRNDTVTDNEERISVIKTYSAGDIQKSEGRSQNEGCHETSHCGEREAFTGSNMGRMDKEGEGSSGDSLKGILEEVRREIERRKYYPPFARRNGIEGVVYINFHIGNDGRPGSISIGISSGSRILDDSAMKTLKSVKQFSTVPEEIRELDITVPIAYRLTEDNKN